MTEQLWTFNSPVIFCNRGVKVHGAKVHGAKVHGAKEVYPLNTSRINLSVPMSGWWFEFLDVLEWEEQTSAHWRPYGTAIGKLLCIPRSISHMSKSEVMCLITFLWVQATGEKQRGRRFFRVWDWNGRNECDICRAIFVLQSKNSSVLWKWLKFGCNP